MGFSNIELTYRHMITFIKNGNDFLRSHTLHFSFFNLIREVMYTITIYFLKMILNYATKVKVSLLYFLRNYTI